MLPGRLLRRRVQLRMSVYGPRAFRGFMFFSEGSRVMSDQTKVGCPCGEDCCCGPDCKCGSGCCCGK